MWNPLTEDMVNKKVSNVLKERPQTWTNDYLPLSASYDGMNTMCYRRICWMYKRVIRKGGVRLERLRWVGEAAPPKPVLWPRPQPKTTSGFKLSRMKAEDKWCVPENCVRDGCFEYFVVSHQYCCYSAVHQKADIFLKVSNLCILREAPSSQGIDELWG